MKEVSMTVQNLTDSNYGQSYRVKTARQWNRATSAIFVTTWNNTLKTALRDVLKLTREMHL